MRKFKYSKDQWVNFVVDGEKHLGQIISASFLAIMNGVEIVSYCVEDSSDASMWNVSEKELSIAPEQELRDRLLESFTNSLWGTPKKKSNISEVNEVPCKDI